MGLPLERNKDFFRGGVKRQHRTRLYCTLKCHLTGKKIERGEWYYERGLDTALASAVE